MTEFIVQLQWLHTSIYHITFVPVTCGMKGIRSNILFTTQTCSSGWMVASIRLIYNPYTLLSHGLTKYCCKILQVSSLFTTENQRWKSWTRKQWNINETSIKHDQSMYIKEFMCPKSLKGAGKHQIISNLFKGAEPSRCRSHGNKQQVSLVNKLLGSVALEPSVLPNIQSHEVRNPSTQENLSKCYVWNLLWKKETNPWFLGVRFLRYPM